MHKIFNDNLFNKSIEIKSQYVKIIQLFTPLGGDIDFDSSDIDLEYNYNILDNKDDLRNHIVLLELSILNNKERSKTKRNVVLSIVVEGIYNIEDNIPENEIKSAKHFGSLNLAINFLRTVLFNITSMTANGGVFLPLINITELHKKNSKPDKEKKSKKIVSKKSK